MCQIRLELLDALDFHFSEWNLAVPNSTLRTENTARNTGLAQAGLNVPGVGLIGKFSRKKPPPFPFYD